MAVFPALLAWTQEQCLVEPEDINSQAAFPQQFLPPSWLAAKLLARIKNRNASFFKVSYASPEAVPPASSLHSPTKGLYQHD